MIQHDEKSDSNIAFHEMMQPLNIIRLCCGNIRDRFAGRTDEAEVAYLSAKLDRIEEQVVRLNALLQKQKGSISS